MKLLDPEEMKVVSEEEETEKDSLGELDELGDNNQNKMHQKAELDQCTGVTQINEFYVDGALNNILSNAHTMVAQFLEQNGYKGFISYHERYGRDVVYYVKCGNIIVIDYHQTSTIIVEALDKHEAGEFVEELKEELGDDFEK